MELYVHEKACPEGDENGTTWTHSEHEWADEDGQAWYCAGQYV